MSDSGWSNSSVFRDYLKDHFIKFIPRREPHQHLLLISDDHKSHISVDIIDWAKEQKIILFVLPAHTSHILQPLDVACFGPFQKIYNNKCQKLMRTDPASISRYDMCKLACETYTLALSAVNLQSAFRKTGIYPVDRNVIISFSVLPAEVFQSSVTNEGDNINGVNSDVAINIDESGDACLNAGICTSSGGHDNINLSQQSDTFEKSPSSFLNDKLNKMCAVKCESSHKHVRNCSSKITSGHAITESPVQKKLVNHFSKGSSSSKGKSAKKSVKRVNKKTQNKSSKSKKVQTQKCKNVNDSPQSSTSHTYVDDSQSSGESEIEESELCCVCKELHLKN
jgi:hypothetical protein